MEEQSRGQAMELGRELLIYIQALQNNMKQVQQAGLYDRNPYFRSRRAKANISAVLDAMGQCRRTLLMYSAALARQGICKPQELQAFFDVYAFLFRYHDDVERQQLGHCLLTRDAETTTNVYRFIEKTKHFVRLQETRQSS